jgi:HEPN domain-containing protein
MSKPRAHWDRVYTRAKEKSQSGLILLKYELYRDCIECLHFSCELGIKAVVLKNGSQPKSTHNLRDLVTTSYKGKKELYLALISNERVKKAFQRIYSAWTVEMRYNVVNLDRNDVDDMARCYGVVFKWLEKNFLNQ